MRKFSSPFVQKRLFNCFSDEISGEMGTLVEPFVGLVDVITEKRLNNWHLMKLYQEYLLRNSHWLFGNAPRRSY